MKWGDLDVNLQKSVFSAVSIVCILLCLCLFKWVHYVLIGLTALASLYLAYMLFLKPYLTKNKDKTKKVNSAKSKLDNILGIKE